MIQAAGDRVRVLRQKSGLSVRQVVAGMQGRGCSVSEKRWRGIEAEGTEKAGVYRYRPLSLSELREFCNLTSGSPAFLVFGMEPADLMDAGATSQEELRGLLHDPLAVEVANDTRHMTFPQREALRVFWLVFVKPLARSPLVNFISPTKPREAVLQYLQAMARMSDADMLVTIKQIGRVFGVDDSQI